MSKAPKKIKVHSLTGRITPKVMRDAFRHVKRNRGAAGIDAVSVRMFENNLDQNLDALMRKLKSREFEPKPLRRVYIPKSDGKQRPLGIPAVRDRVAQEVVRRIVEPVFEPLFHESSFGFRRGRSCHMAVEELIALQREGYTHVVDADIKGFFDNIPHKVIMKAVAAEIADGNILGLIEKFLRAGVMEDGVLSSTNSGTPQGGVISPLLANIVLNHLDWRLHEAGYRFVRYADDFVICARSKPDAEEALRLATDILTELGLELSPEKTVVTSFREGFTFLGFAITSQAVKMSPKAVKNFKKKAGAITRRSHNLDAEVIEKLNRLIRGTANYFVARFTKSATLIVQLDRWVRMRVRCMKFGRKRRTDHFRLRKKHITALGVLSFDEIASGVKAG